MLPGLRRQLMDAPVGYQRLTVRDTAGLLEQLRRAVRVRDEVPGGPVDRARRQLVDRPVGVATGAGSTVATGVDWTPRTMSARATS